MKYNVVLDFHKVMFNIEADCKKNAYINALSKAINVPKVQAESLFNEMIQAGMNCSYLKELECIK